MLKKEETSLIVFYRQELADFLTAMSIEEKAPATIEKYARDIQGFLNYVEAAGGTEIEKSQYLAYKESLLNHYKASSINSMITAINQYLKFIHHSECCLRPLRIQKQLFEDPQKSLSQQEYRYLVTYAYQTGKEKIALIMETLCATGIRVGELREITLEGVRKGKIQIQSKGKNRMVYLPSKLKKKLESYAEKENITKGAVFITKTGKAIDRKNIWAMMKALADAADIDGKKVFPHNLRHLFAKTYYAEEKDLACLAALLGHSNIETTRIYTKTTGNEFYNQIEKMGLVL